EEMGVGHWICGWNAGGAKIGPQETRNTGDDDNSETLAHKWRREEMPGVKRGIEHEGNDSGMRAKKG
ncbi:MAG: hypothetical protein ACKPKO_33355, partial [Candidatus Fonsibacter sp.]